jgi:hypothetical protein
MPGTAGLRQGPNMARSRFHASKACKPPCRVVLGRVKLVMLQACPFSLTQMVRYNHKTTRRAIRATPFVMLIEIVCLSFAIDRFVK